MKLSQQLPKEVGRWLMRLFCAYTYHARRSLHGVRLTVAIEGVEGRLRVLILLTVSRAGRLVRAISGGFWKAADRYEEPSRSGAAARAGDASETCDPHCPAHSLRCIA